MHLTTQDHLKTAITNLQEHVRDFMHYSSLAEDKKISQCFKQCAETHAKQAADLQKFLKKN